MGLESCSERKIAWLAAYLCADPLPASQVSMERLLLMQALHSAAALHQLPLSAEADGA